MRVSYDGPETLYEIELPEPLRSMASKKHTVGLNGIVEFEMLSNPGIAAGDSILIDAYEPGERILGVSDFLMAGIYLWKGRGTLASCPEVRRGCRSDIRPSKGLALS